MRSVMVSADRLAVLILAAVAIAAGITFRDYGLGWDDYTHSQYGDLLLKLYGSGFADMRALSFVNLYKYGGGFDMAAALAAKVLPFGLFETRRLVGAAVGMLGLFVTWRTYSMNVSQRIVSVPGPSIVVVRPLRRTDAPSQASRRSV
jgi:hypothetical protein